MTLDWKATRSDLGTIYNGWTARQEIAARVYRSEDGRAWVAEVRLPAGRPNRIMAGFRTAKDAKAEAAAEYSAARVAHHHSEESAGFPAMRTAGEKAAREDAAAVRAAPAHARLAMHRRIASGEAPRAAFLATGSVGHGPQWVAFLAAYDAERTRIRQAWMDANHASNVGRMAGRAFATADSLHRYGAEAWKAAEVYGREQNAKGRPVSAEVREAFVMAFRSAVESYSDDNETSEQHATRRGIMRGAVKAAGLIDSSLSTRAAVAAREAYLEGIDDKEGREAFTAGFLRAVAARDSDGRGAALALNAEVR